MVSFILLIIILPSVDVLFRFIQQEPTYKKLAFSKQAGQFLIKTPNFIKQAQKFLITPVRKLKNINAIDVLHES